MALRRANRGFERLRRLQPGCLANWVFVVTNTADAEPDSASGSSSRTGAAKRQAGRKSFEELDSRGGGAGKAPSIVAPPAFSRAADHAVLLEAPTAGRT